MLVFTLFLLGLAAGIILYMVAQNRRSQISQKQFEDQIRQLEVEKLNLEEKIYEARDSARLASDKWEEALKEHDQQMFQMERYRLLVEDTDEFLFETNYKGQFLYANPVMLNRLGYAEEELAALSYDQLVLPANQKAVFQFYHKQYHDRQPDSYAEWQVINRFGEEVWVGLRVRMTFDPIGRIASVKGIARDLSIQRSNERQSQEQIDQFEEIFKLLPSPVLVFKKTEKGLADAFLTWTNKPALRLMNLDWFEVAGLRMEDVSSNLVSIVYSIFNSSVEPIPHWSPKTNRDQKFEVQSFQGKQTILVILTDVTEAGAKVQQLENERDFYKMIVDEIPFDIAVFSADERFRYINKSAVKNDDVRKWMIGKTDTEYMKFRQKELFHAVLRRLRFNEVRAAGTTIRFDELFVDNQNQLLYFVRNLKPVFNKESDIEYFIAAGFNYSDLYFQTEPDCILADQWLFQSLWHAHFPGLSHQPWAGNDGVRSGLNVAGTLRPVHGGHFQLYAETLPNFEYHIKQLSVSSLKVEMSLFQNRRDIYMIPKVLIEETVKVACWLSREENGILRLSFVRGIHSESCLVIEIQLTAFQARLPELQTLAKIWEHQGFKTCWLENTLVLEMVLQDLRKPITDQTMRDMQILKMRKVLVGPINHVMVANYTHQLQESGAEVSHLADFEELEAYLAHEEPDLIVWWGKAQTALATSLVDRLTSQTVKILFYDPNPKLPRLTPIADQTLHVQPEPDSLEVVLEDIWLLAKEVSLRAPVNEEYVAKFEVKFTKLAEITDGDTVFTTSLIRSYIISLQECQAVFVHNIEAQDKEGLKFLLHKIRATIKTFEIKSLELVIREAIQLMDENKPLSVKRKKDLVSRLRLICDEANRQINEYATANDLKV